VAAVLYSAHLHTNSTLNNTINNKENTINKNNDKNNKNYNTLKKEQHN